MPNPQTPSPERSQSATRGQQPYFLIAEIGYEYVAFGVDRCGIRPTPSV
jgi:hypothetical protein